MWHGILINQIVSSVFILTTRNVFCSTNVLSVAAFNATTSISARHNILSARTPASYTVTFEAVATDELQECLWCRLLVHPVNGYVTVNHIPAMTMWTWRMSCRFQGILPNAGLVICSGDMVLESIFGWRQIAGLCIIAAEQFVPNSSPCFRTVSTGTEHILTAVRRHGRTNDQTLTSYHGSAHVWVGLDRNGTPAFCLFQRMHLCCHIRLKQAALCTHLHQAIVQWQSCQGTCRPTSFVASCPYRIASWH